MPIPRIIAVVLNGTGFKSTCPEVRATLEENFKIAEDMGLNGTPSYVIGKDVVVGAVGLEGLTKKISEARCGKAVC